LDEARGMTTRIVCAGGGFVAFHLARGLRREIRASRVELTIVSRENFLAFHGFSHEMLSGKIQPGQIINPARRIFPPAKFHNAEIEAIDIAGRVVKTSRLLDGRQYALQFDHLVLALGSVDDLSRYAGVAEHALKLKTYWDCFRTRNHILSMLEMAELEQDSTERARLLTFVIAGGNFGGIEVATELHEFLLSLAGREYARIRREEVRVIVVHGTSRILPELQLHDEPLVSWAERYLAHSGIEFRPGTRVQAATATEVILDTGERISARTIISCAGTAHSPLIDSLDLPRDETGRIETDEFLRVAGHLNVWAGGDCAAVPHPKGGICPPIAIFAMTAGRQIARNLRCGIEGRLLESYRFTGLGSAVSLGHRRAVGSIRGLRLYGFTAWVCWRLVFLYFVPTFDRKVRLVLDWLVWPLIGRDIVDMKAQQPLAVQYEHFEPGQEIIRQGDIGQRLYLIWEGEVDVVQDGPSGLQYLRTLQSGDHFGEIALFENVRRSATVRARTSVKLVSIGRGDALAISSAMRAFGNALQTAGLHRQFNRNDATAP
jgi:NADH:ubiquinone reductase (H+-translocating)